MKISKNKTKIFTMTLVMLAVVAFAATIYPVSAIDVDTTSLITVTPNPSGVYQTVQVIFQIDKVSPSISSISGGPGQDFFTGFKVNIVKPDNTIINLPETGSYTVTAGSQAWFTYTPDQVGTYIFEVTFPGQTIISTRPSFTFPVPGEYYFKPSSGSTTLVVQEEPIMGYTGSPPLPTDPWTRPIYSENKGWWQIADDWLLPAYDYPTAAPWGQTYWARYNSAPESPHVLWKKPLYFGGIVGGQFEDRSFYSGLTYEEFFPQAIIQQGRIIYVDHGATSGGILGGDFYGSRILNLYTGEEIVFLDGITIDFAQNLLYDSGNEHGVLPYLWDKNGSTWDMYDAFSARKILSITDVPSGLQTVGPKGEILVYGFSGSPGDRYYWLWNSTKCIGGSPVFGAPNIPGIEYSEVWNPRTGSVIPGMAGIQWNASIPTLTENVIGLETPQFVGLGYQIGDPDNNGFLLAAYLDRTDYPHVYVHTAYPATLNKQTDGTYPNSTSHLWTANRTDTYAALGLQKLGYEGIGPDRVFAQYSEDTLKFHGYSIETGAKLWETETLTSGFAVYTYAYRVANGFLYEGGFDGVLRACYANNGSLAWEHSQGLAGYENAWGTYPIYTGFTIADGKIYVSTDEHSPDSVMWRGGMLQCVDAYTGEHLWDVSGWFRRPIIADGILTTVNSLDGQLYAFGKGPSATTVSAPLTAVTLGSSVMITGTVTDQTPATKDTPAVSDESMGSWMEYLHMQKTKPQDATGVTVKLTALDPNGNFQDLGEVITDLGGTFGKSWTPPVPGEYHITATFEGSQSYGSSYATTYFVVDPAPSPSGPIEPEPSPSPSPSPSESPSPSPSPAAPLITTEIAIVAVVAVAAVIGIAAYWVLRKRR